MRDTLEPLAAGGPVEIGIEDAGGASKLQLEALSFADLQRRVAEPLDELGGGQANEVAALLRNGRQRARRRGLRRLDVGRRRAGSSEQRGEQSGEEGDAAHGGTLVMASAARQSGPVKRTGLLRRAAARNDGLP